MSPYSIESRVFYRMILSFKKTGWYCSEVPKRVLRWFFTSESRIASEQNTRAQMPDYGMLTSSILSSPGGLFFSLDSNSSRWWKGLLVLVRLNPGSAAQPCTPSSSWAFFAPYDRIVTTAPTRLHIVHCPIPPSCRNFALYLTQCDDCTDRRYVE